MIQFAAWKNCDDYHFSRPYSTDKHFSTEHSWVLKLLLLMLFLSHWSNTGGSNLECRLAIRFLNLGENKRNLQLGKCIVQVPNCKWFKLEGAKWCALCCSGCNTTNTMATLLFFLFLTCKILFLSPLHSAEKSQYLSVQFSNEVLAVAKEKAMKGESGMKSALQIRASSVCGWRQ